MKFYLNIYEGFKNFASSTNHAHISFIYLTYLFRSPILSIYLPASPPSPPPPPQQPRLSNFASIPTVSQVLESIKYWIVVIIISSSIILFLLFELDFFFYLKIYQNLISEYLRIWFLKRSAYGAYIKSEYINVFFTAMFFSLFFFIYIL